MSLAARRARRFPGRDGESLDDVGARAAFFVRHCILPWLHRADASTTSPPSSPQSSSIALTASTKADSLLSNLRPVHIVVVAHGIFLSELLRHLLVLAQSRPDARHHEPPRLAGFANTGWTRVEIGLHPSSPTRPANLFSSPASAADPPHWPAPPPSFPARFTLPVLVNGAASPTVSVDSEEEAVTPRLVVRVLQLNQSAHLAGLKRQGGGIGSAAFDKDQKSLKAFFAGQSPASASSQQPA